MEKQRSEKIAIVGAGVSGLLACKYALENGFSPVVFEATTSVGGIWGRTIESTKLQTPKSFYEFSDFPWPSSVKEAFPRHDQVLEYLQAYATHFNIIPMIKFNSAVISIDYLGPSDETMACWDSWGGTDKPFSPAGKWKLTVNEAHPPFSSNQKVNAYEFDFVILCIGKYSDLPSYPDFPVNKGPEIFGGKVLHSMDYSAMDDELASELIKDKLVTVVGFQKSAVDLAAEVARKNGERHPCTLLFRAPHWAVPEIFVTCFTRSFNRFSELMVHKPGEGLFHWLLAFIFTPWNLIFGKLSELYLQWIYPLKKYDVVPNHSFLEQMAACNFMILAPNFFSHVEEGKLILKKSESFSFCEKGLILDGETSPLLSDIVIFATGYKSEDKLKNIFSSFYFQRCLSGSSAPLYRECIHPRVPNLAILGYADSASILYTTEMRTMWIFHFLAGKFKLPAVREMENNMLQWEKSMRGYSVGQYKRSCTRPMLQIHSNDQMCKDMGCNPMRKKWFLIDLFAPYGPIDYKNMTSRI